MMDEARIDVIDFFQAAYDVGHGSKVVTFHPVQQTWHAGQEGWMFVRGEEKCVITAS